MIRKLIFVLILLTALPLFAASDVLTIGTLSAQRGTVAAVPVYVRDVSGSPLGMDQTAANRIQGIGFKVTYAPASAVSAATFTRAGVLQGLTALYETVLTPAGSVGYVGSFAQSTNPIPFTSNAAAPGNLIGYLNLTIPQNVAGGTIITLTVDATNAALSNQAGTVIETGNNGKLTVINGALTVTSTASGLVRADFNHDSRSDIWWRNTTTGDNYVWYVNGSGFTGGETPPVVGGVAVFSGTGDFNNDGRADVLWRNTSNGGISVWFMNGGTFTGGVALPSVSPSNVIIAGIGDFNGDGNADILWRNTSTGENSVWFINASGFAGGAVVPTVNDPNLVVAAVADFNGDGRADILWRNNASGAHYIWLMNGGTLTGGSQLPTLPTTLVVAATGDFNGDGSYDLLWRNTTTGDNSIWFINSNGFQGGVAIPTVNSTAVQIVAPK